MLRSLDDFILKIKTDVDEIITIAGDSHYEISVFFGMLLCVTERFGSDHIELDVMSVHSKVCTDEMRQFSNALFIGQQLW